MPDSMSVPSHSAVYAGRAVSIILKADQRTGRQVQGIVQDVLTRGNHPRGVKVRLTDGRVGRVQQLATSGSDSSPPTNSSGNSSSVQSRRYQPDVRNDPYFYDESQAGTERPQQYSIRFQNRTQRSRRGQTQNQNPAFSSTPPTDGIMSGLASQRRDEQLEMHRNQYASSQDEANQATLQREFPSLDSSLVAAIYGDSKDLAETRQVLRGLVGAG